MKYVHFSCNRNSFLLRLRTFGAYIFTCTLNKYSKNCCSSETSFSFLFYRIFFTCIHGSVVFLFVSFSQ